MTSEHWHTSVDPKVKGAWNLHNALKGRDTALDFFLITSSISGTVGTATESNYCAANAFLDAFARHRRSQGLPATALGLGMISEVGYLHEHPEIEAILVRKGIHAINEDEMLQVCDIALSPQASVPDIRIGEDYFAQAHFLTGLEILGLDKIRKSGFEGPRHMLYRDPRVGIIGGALSAISSNSASRANGSENAAATNLPHLATCIATYRQATAEATQTEASRELIDVVQGLVGQKLRDVFLLTEQPTAQTKLTALGMDSMMAAELRLFLFQTFKVDVPFLALLSSTTTLDSLADTIVKSLIEDLERKG